MNYTLVFLSGGTGSRMNNPIPKQYMPLSGKPIIVHCLETIETLDSVEKIIIVCANEYKAHIIDLLEHYKLEKPVEFAPAGETRQASVLSGLKKVKTRNVIIHEAARPFVSKADYEDLLAEPCENAMLGLDIPFTVIKGHDNVEGILNRSELVNVQLPQKFNTKALLDAHLKAEREKRKFTEDAGLLFFYNPDKKIKIVRGKDYNIKVTTQIDMLVGELIYSELFNK